MCVRAGVTSGCNAGGRNDDLLIQSIKEVYYDNCMVIRNELISKVNV